MRNDELCKVIAKEWEKEKQWTFGQLVGNVFGDVMEDGRDPYRVDNEETAEYFRKYFAKRE